MSNVWSTDPININKTLKLNIKHSNVHKNKNNQYDFSKTNVSCMYMLPC